jgi:hypothetical protein
MTTLHYMTLAFLGQHDNFIQALTVLMWTWQWYKTCSLSQQKLYMVCRWSKPKTACAVEQSTYLPVLQQFTHGHRHKLSGEEITKEGVFL